MHKRLLPLTLFLLFACAPAQVEEAKSPPAPVSPSVISIATKKPTPSVPPSEDGPRSVSGKTRRALLIGCSRYPNLPLGMQLRGPANDVHLVRDLLVKRFGFSTKNITILSEAEGEQDEARRPIRANIKREYERLAKEAKKGDMVYIHMSGHGSQQPQKNPDDPESYEPDGLSEIFLPTDVDLWDDKGKGVTNAIVDTEFRDWLKAIRAKEAAVVIVVDTCHSGTMIRGEEQAREVSMEALKIPEKAVIQAREKAIDIREKKGPVKRGVERVSSNVPDLVAIYASRPHEPTFEDRFPRTSRDAKRYGLFTFTLVEVMTSAPADLTYVEAVQRVCSRYVRMGRNGPVPSVEGKYRDLPFLAGNQEFRDPSQMRLFKDGDVWKIDRGAIHGLTQGTVLAVYPSALSEKKLGHVMIASLDALESQVRPCEFAGMPAAAKLPEDVSCRKVYVNMGSDALRVAIERGSKQVEIRDAVQKLSKASQALIRLVDVKDAPEWLIRETEQGAVLLPASGWAGNRGQRADRFFGPTPFDDKLAAWLESTLPRISRATNLLKLTAAMEQEQALETDQSFSPKVNVNVLLLPKGQLAGAHKVPWGANGMILHEKDIIVFEFTNEGKQAVDVSLLFVDNHYGIFPLFPQPGTETDNRLKPGEKRHTPKVRINTKTQGIEHIVVLAVRSQTDRLRTDFSSLAQPTIEKTRDMIPDDPLGKLLQSSMFGVGTARGMEQVEYRNFATRVLSWTTVPGVRKTE